VAVVDDHLLVGRLVVGLVERAGYTAELAYRETEAETWKAVEGIAPDLILLDFDLGPHQSAVRILEQAHQAEMLVAGFTGSDDRLEHAAFLEAGAAAIVMKEDGPSELVAMVELALAGHDLMSAAERHTALARLRRHRDGLRRALAPFEMLTERESETLAMVAAGHGAAEIAATWDVALATVRSHIRAVLTKLGVSSQLQAVAVARDSGWYERMCGKTSSILTMPSGMETGTIARRSGSKG